MDASHYRIFQIPKKNGTREIAEPLPELKQEQQDILKWLCERDSRERLSDILNLQPVTRIDVQRNKY